ncbi:MAG: hypothetical protein HOP34_02335 [Methylococcaceae bacterium]|nr:hypothetical protein [Methylococcaceae bacterium]
MSPQTIKRAKFTEVFNKPSSNKNEAKKFLAKYSIEYSVDDVILPEYFELKSNKAKTKIRLLDRTDKDNPRIVYAVDIKINQQVIAHHTCTQVLVWASPSNEDLLIGFPRKIFNHLLKRYAIMITDQEQTPDGKRFWERRIVQAFNDGLLVYFYDTMNHLLMTIKNSDDFFENYEPESWGNDKVHKNILFIISATPISQLQKSLP